MSSIAIKFLYEDNDLFIVEKPWGLHSVEVKGGGESLAGKLLQIYPELAHASEKEGDAGLVHRLDFDTSGLLIGAKSRSVWMSLHEQLQGGGIEKSYKVLLSGKLAEALTISSFIGSPYRGGKKVRVYPDLSSMRGKVRALWGETKIEPVQVDALGNTEAIVTASPARRHQVRVHSAYSGFPLVGDSLYGAKDQLCDLYMEERTFFLHCSYLSFLHPTTCNKVVFTSDLQAPSPRER